jgi:hypothetical protein
MTNDAHREIRKRSRRLKTARTMRGAFHVAVAVTQPGLTIVLEIEDPATRLPG